MKTVEDETPYLGPCFTAKKRDPDTCPHLPLDQYVWFVTENGKRLLCAVCFACNTVIRNDGELYQHPKYHKDGA